MGIQRHETKTLLFSLDLCRARKKKKKKTQLRFSHPCEMHKRRSAGDHGFLPSISLDLEPIYSSLVGDFGQLDYVTPTVGYKRHRKSWSSNLTAPWTNEGKSLSCADHTAVCCATGDVPQDDVAQPRVAPYEEKNCHRAPLDRAGYQIRYKDKDTVVKKRKTFRI